jgi:hypothetical protein
MTHRVVDGADHALSSKTSQEAYTSILVNWITEMVIGARVGGRANRYHGVRPKGDPSHQTSFSTYAAHTIDK